jgi:hypothetical protein
MRVNVVRSHYKAHAENKKDSMYSQNDDDGEEDKNITCDDHTVE